jgi:divalent metal cation (Fe/Co/Zn/Cd) transporter
LIIGEAADPTIQEAVRATVAEDTQITGLLRLITVQQGPGEVVVAMKVSFLPALTTVEISRAINQFEDRLRARCPEVRWSFIEPDVPRSP